MNYKRIYFAIIRHRKQNPATIEEHGYIEIHHIIPRSLGGTDDPSNLVSLTAREHYIVHVLLYKIFKKRSLVPALSQKDKKMNSLANMAAALRFMGHTILKDRHNSNTKVFINGELFQKCRIQANQELKQWNLQTMKEMYEFYISRNCSSNDKQYALLQDKFGYAFKKSSLVDLLTRNGFNVQETIRSVTSKKVVAMYSDFVSNRTYWESNYEDFQNKWNYYASQKTLRNLFSVYNLSLRPTEFVEYLMQIVNGIEERLQSFTTNIMQSTESFLSELSNKEKTAWLQFNELITVNK